MADHDLLLNIVAAVSYGAEQGRCCVDTAVRLKPSTLEQAVFVVAMVRNAAVFVVLGQTHLRVRSISVDVQYFVCAVVAMLICSFVPSRATSVLKGIAATAVVTSVALSIQTASELINAPAGLQLQVPMPVIGIDWMQVLLQVASLFFLCCCKACAGRCHESGSRFVLLFSLPQASHSCYMSPFCPVTSSQCRTALPALGHGSSRCPPHASQLILACKAAAFVVVLSQHYTSCPAADAVHEHNNSSHPLPIAYACDSFPFIASSRLHFIRGGCPSAVSQRLLAARQRGGVV
jgi:hypothetical protein